MTNDHMGGCRSTPPCVAPFLFRQDELTEERGTGETTACRESIQNLHLVGRHHHLNFHCPQDITSGAYYTSNIRICQPFPRRKWKKACASAPARSSPRRRIHGPRLSTGAGMERGSECRFAGSTRARPPSSGESYKISNLFCLVRLAGDRRIRQNSYFVWFALRPPALSPVPVCFGCGLCGGLRGAGLLRCRLVRWGLFVPASAPAPLVLLCFPRASAHLRGARSCFACPSLGRRRGNGFTVYAIPSPTSCEVPGEIPDGGPLSTGPPSETSMIPPARVRDYTPAVFVRSTPRLLCHGVGER